MKLIISIILIFIFVSGNAQNWTKLSNGTQQGNSDGLDFQARCIVADTIHDLIYVGGNFNYADSVFVNHIAQWDGLEWSSLQPSAINSGTPIYSMAMFQDTLYAGGDFDWPNLNSGIAKWSGIHWDTVGLGVNNVVRTFLEAGGELYVGGLFDSVARNPGIAIAKWDGLLWSTFPFQSSSNYYYPLTMAFFDNYLCIGGNFYFGNGMNDLSQWNGSVMQTLGGGLLGSLSEASCMVVFQNELYIGGYFQKSSGNAGNFIMKWNGTTFTEVGGGTNDFVSCLKVYQNELYAAGNFTIAGSTNVTDHLAKWNGINWLPISNAVFDNNIGDMAFLNGDLYVVGGFSHIDNVQINYAAKYPLTTSISEKELDLTLSIYPTLTTGRITINSEKQIIRSINVYNLLGKLIYSAVINDNHSQIDLGKFSNEVYIVQVEGNGFVMRKKIVKM